jgi:sterol desaturase/sphingolipid hydroxylase (fatty acid hydroxylase superfamily)
MGVFFFTIALMACLEIVIPRRQPSYPKKVRWFNNLIIAIADSLAARLILPILPIGLAVVCADKGWGLFNRYSLGAWLPIISGIMILDLMIYLQHVMFHKIPILWRLHMMHHMDLDLDVTSGVRFHPLEIILSYLIKNAAVLAFGPPAIAVLIFELLLNNFTMFNHSNLRIPGALDRFLRLFIITPDMHRVHHSVIKRENNSNYGFSVPWWDFIFKTYIAQPAAGHERMTIGLAGYRDMKYSTLGGMLAAPFMKNR